MENIIIIAIVLLIIFAASYYIFRAKKSGKKCIGCPNADSCSKKVNMVCCEKNHQIDRNND